MGLLDGIFGHKKRKDEIEETLCFLLSRQEIIIKRITEMAETVQSINEKADAALASLTSVRSGITEIIAYVQKLVAGTVTQEQLDQIGVKLQSVVDLSSEVDALDEQAKPPVETTPEEGGS